GHVGIKVVTTAPGNAELNKKMINGLVMLADYQTGEPLCLLDAGYLTKIRTGAISAVATKYLSNQSSNSIGIIGTGEQAYGLLEAINHVRNLKKLYLFNRSKDRAEKFKDFVLKNYELTVEVVDSPEAVINKSDILVTTTNSTQPVFSGPLKKGMHVNAVGSFRPTMQELPTSIFKDVDKLVVESKHDALEETGDLITPLNEGIINENSIYNELGKLIGEQDNYRDNESEITLFKSVGLGVVDVIIADYFYRKAVENNKGSHIKF